MSWTFDDQSTRNAAAMWLLAITAILVIIWAWNQMKARRAERDDREIRIALRLLNEFSRMLDLRQNPSMQSFIQRCPRRHRDFLRDACLTAMMIHHDAQLPVRNSIIRQIEEMSRC